MHFLLDTNIALDLLLDRQPFSRAAARLFDHGQKGNVRLYLTTVSYNNLYYVIRKLTTHKETIRLLQELESLTETIGVTKEVINQSLNSEFKDFEDAIQYFAARTNKKMDAIVTRNLADFKLSKLSVLSPDEALGLIENEDR